MGRGLKRGLLVFEAGLGMFFEVGVLGFLKQGVSGNGSGGNEVFVNKELVARGYAEVWRFGNDTRRCGEIEGKG